MLTAAMSLSGIQKSAVLCLALGPEKSAQILRQLAPDEVEAVSREIARLQEVEPEVVNHVLQEFNMVSGSSERAVLGGMSAARQLLQRAFGDSQAASLLDRVQKKLESGTLSHLERVEPRMFASVLLDEHPQTIAVILSHIDIKQAGRALDELPVETASEVLFRMAAMDKVGPDMLAVLEDGLRSKTDLSLSQELSAAGDAARAAKLLNLAAGARSEQILDRIKARNGELAARIKTLMFSFEDLLLIDRKGVQAILANIDSKEFALAMKGASAELKAHVRSNMSERAATALEEQIELLGPVRVKDVEAAQQTIMEEVRKLEEAGEVVVRREGEDGEFIE